MSEKNRVVFLHDKKRVMSKEERALYIKTRRDTSNKKISLAKSKGFVVKDNFELVVGVKDYSSNWGTDKLYRKYEDKYGYFRGTHQSKDRR
jgi:hypothetical protein